ncbi:MAG: hypothetical protein ACXWP6_02075 [Ktedonobacterales bacterium]
MHHRSVPASFLDSELVLLVQRREGGTEVGARSQLLLGPVGDHPEPQQTPK